MTIPIIDLPNDGITSSEIGNVQRFFIPDKLLTFAVLKPSVYQPSDLHECQSVVSVLYDTPNTLTIQ